jgi:O-antigen/teichoic acid export membrane protein
MKLRERILSAGAWTLGAFVVELGTKLVSNLVLTRLLFPEAFGLVAASASILTGLALVSDVGIRAVVVQSPRGEDDSFLRSAWVFQIVRGVALWLVLILICFIFSLTTVRNLFAPSSAFADPQFALLTIVQGFAIVLHGFESTAIALNIRRLNYAPIVLVDLAGKLFPVPVMITVAIYFPSVWALVAGILASNLLRAILSHCIVPGPRMAFVWTRQHFDEMMHFGKWIAVSSTASFFISQADILLFGIAFPGAFLGVYSLAKTLIDTAEGLLERLNSVLTLPVFSEVLRRDPTTFREKYYRFRFPTDLVAAATAGFVFVTADLIVGVLYDARYTEAGPILRILAVGLALYPFTLIRSAFTATGNTRLVAATTVVQASALVSCVLLGVHLVGPLGAIAGAMASRAVVAAILVYAASKSQWVSGWRELRIILFLGLGLLVGKIALMAALSLGLADFHLSDLKHILWR